MKGWLTRRGKLSPLAYDQAPAEKGVEEAPRTSRPPARGGEQPSIEVKGHEAIGRYKKKEDSS